MSGTDRPDRPGLTAVIEELDVRRHVRISAVAGIAFAVVVFVLFAYLPGTEESLLFWAGLTFVLAFAVVVLLAAVLVGREAYRLARETDDHERGGRSPTTLAFLFGLVGWLAFVIAGISPRFSGPAVAVLTAGCAAIAVGAIGIRLVCVLSLTHVWRPRVAAVGAGVYTAVVAAVSIGAVRLGTPEELLAAVVGVDLGAVAAGYAVVVLGGGALVGVAVGLRAATPPHGFFAGTVAAISVLPIVAAVTGDPETIRATGIYLPVVFGSVGAAGNAVGYVAYRRHTGR